MAKKISQLPAAATVNDTDELELNQGGASKKATRAQLLEGQTHAIGDVTGLQDALDGKAASDHDHALEDITDAGALAAKDAVEIADLAAAAYASQAEATTGTENTKLMTPLRTAEAITALASGATFAGLQDVVWGPPNDNETPSYDSELGKLVFGPPSSPSLDNNPINMQDQVLTRPAIKDFSEISTEPTISANTLTLDLEAGNVFEVTLDQDVTSLVLSNPPAAGRAGSVSLILKQDATGGRTLTWPANVKWALGAPPQVTAAANAIDVYSLVTRDAGATWFGFPAAQDML